MFANVGQKIAAFFSYFLDRYKPAILTLLVLAGVFYFYFNVVVSQNEAALHDRSFRGLHRIGANIAAKLSDYAERNADNFLKALADTLDTPGKPSAAQLRNDYGLLPVETGKKDSAGTGRLNVRYNNGWKFYFTNAENKTAVANVRDFVAPFLRRDLFSHYFFACDDTVLFDERNLANQRRSDFLKSPAKPDTTKSGAVRVGEALSVQIGGHEYKLFVLSFAAEGTRRFSIGGYLPAERYQSEQRYVPTYAVIWLVIGLLVVLMFPLLKIFLMQPSEQLMARNVVASFAALHMTGAVAVLVALNVYVYFTFVMPKADKTLKTLALDTQRVFLSELDSALHEMRAVEAATKADPSLLDSDRLLKIFSRDTTANVAPASGYAPGKSYPYFHNLAWANDTGLQSVRWTTLRYRPQKINVAERDYFAAVKSGNLLVRGPDSFALSVVSSWVSKQKLLVLAKPFRGGDSSRRLVMMSLSAPFRSVFNAVLPHGYGFCILQPNGDVLFHLDPARNLNENLLEETEEESLQALLDTRTEGFAGVRYAGSTQRFYLLPLQGTPLTVAVFRDMRQLWSEDLDVISACSILSLMNLAVILLAIIVIQISGYRHSLLQNQSIMFTWLRPNKMLVPAYRGVTAFLLLATVLQMIFFFTFNDEDQLSTLGIAFSYSYLLIFYLYYRFAIVDNRNKIEQSRNKKLVAALAVIYGFTTVMLLLTLHSGRDHFALAQVLLLGLGTLVHFAPALRRGPFAHKDFRWWYVSSLFAFVAATGIVPMILFYCLAFKEERLLSLKDNQLHFAESLRQQPPDPLARPVDSLRLFPPVYAAPYHGSSFADKVLSSAAWPAEQTDSVNGFERLYRQIKPAFSDHSREMEKLTSASHGRSESDFYWHYRTNNDTLRFYDNSATVQTLLKPGGLAMLSHIEIGVDDTGKRMVRAWDNTLLLVLALLLLLKGFEYLLKRLVQRTFFEGYDDATHLTESDLPLVDTLPADENVYIIGPVNSGKHGAIVERLRGKGIEIIEVDLAELTTKGADEVAAAIKLLTDAHKAQNKRCVVLLRHFEICMNDFSVAKKKLLLLETLIMQRQQIVILSSRSVDTVPTALRDEKGSVVEELTDRWSNAMNQFYNLYHHWKRREDDAADKAMVQKLREVLLAEGEKKTRAYLNGVLANGDAVYGQRKGILMDQINKFVEKVDMECAHSDFLWSLRPTLFAYIEAQKTAGFQLDFQSTAPAHMRRVMAKHFIAQFEQAVLKLQSLAANYYLAIWRSLGRDEQRTLFDIGTDEMVNPANRSLAARLANLGLVKPEEHIACYQVMNRSFRNFIFTQLNRKEVQTLQAGADEKQSWSSFQLPVLTVVIGIAVFLFATQKDAFTNLVAYLGAAAGGIAALLKVLGMIPSTKS